MLVEILIFVILIRKKLGREGFGSENPNPDLYSRNEHLVALLSDKVPLLSL